LGECTSAGNPAGKPGPDLTEPNSYECVSGSGLELGTAAGSAGDLLVDNLASRVFAAAAAAADRQVTLYVEERRRPTLDFLANIAIGDGMADADVHGSPLETAPGWGP
jgi:hypothetical protein